MVCVPYTCYDVNNRVRYTNSVLIRTYPYTTQPTTNPPQKKDTFQKKVSEKYIALRRTERKGIFKGSAQLPLNSRNPILLTQQSFL